MLLGLSGGVDSSVVAALLHRAIGVQLTCIFVDNGLLRWREGDQVMATFAEHLGVRVIRVDAAERFYSALAGLADPEDKRKAIGRSFIEVFEEEAAKLGEVRWLAQGTIYPDVIESAASKTGKAHVIKSQHNVGGLPERMRMQLVEPLRELFKDEVRRLGVALGLPAEMVYRRQNSGRPIRIARPQQTASLCPAHPARLNPAAACSNLAAGSTPSRPCPVADPPDCQERGHRALSAHSSFQGEPCTS